ncbi:MAG: molybdate transport system permease, partial [Bradyrhizobium sp. DFCI-1]
MDTTGTITSFSSAPMTRFNIGGDSYGVQMLTLWTDPNPIQAGVYNNVQIQADVSNTGGGYLKVSINGTQVVDY